MKLFDPDIQEWKKVEAWISLSHSEFILILPLWFPRRDEWKSDFGRFSSTGIRQSVICLRVVNRATKWWPAVSLGRYQREIRIESQEPCRPKPFLPTMSIDQAKTFSGMGDDELAAAANGWEKTEDTVEVWADGKISHAPATDAEKGWLPAWSNPVGCRRFIVALGCGLRVIGKRSHDGSIPYEIYGPTEHSYVWRTDEFDNKAFLPGIRWALAMRCKDTAEYEGTKGKAFVSVRCKHCGKTEEWVYNVPSYGFISFFCSKCERHNSIDTLHGN